MKPFFFDGLATALVTGLEQRTQNSAPAGPLGEKRPNEMEQSDIDVYLLETPVKYDFQHTANILLKIRKRAEEKAKSMTGEFFRYPVEWITRFDFRIRK